jgi:hypothetical protein
VSEVADELLEQVFRPRNLPRPRRRRELNRLVGLTTKWRGNSLYFAAVYRSYGPTALAPGFQRGFARIRYLGPGRFEVSYHRHNDTWWPILTGVTLQRCVAALKSHELLQP